MTSYRAIVKYRLDAGREEKIRELRDGLRLVTMELVDLDVPLEKIELWLEGAYDSACELARSVVDDDEGE